MWQNHQLPSVQSYSLPAVMPVPSSSLFLLPPPPSHPPKYHPEILFECTIFRKARFTFIRPLYTRNALARVGQIYIYLYECLWRRHFSTYFSSRSAVILFLFFFFIFLFTLATAETCIIRALETPDRYRRVSRDNFFFYHSETTVVVPAKRSRQHIHAT